MEAWLLVIGTGWSGLTTVPNIASHQECERLAATLQLADYKCFAYRIAKGA